MAKWRKTLLCIAFSFIFVFMVIGYASVADTLLVEGNATLEYDGVVITHVEVVSNGSNATSNVKNILHTNIDSTIYASQSAQTVVKYAITVHNFSETISYNYMGIVLGDEYDNSLYKNGTLEVATTYMKDGVEVEYTTGSPIGVGETVTFYATYTVPTSAVSGGSIRTFMNYKYGVGLNSAGDFASQKALEQFEKILNSEAYLTQQQREAFAEAIGDHGYGFFFNKVKYRDVLLDPTNKNYKENVTLFEVLSWILDGYSASGDYVGNVSGSSQYDKDTLAELFDGNLTLSTVDENGNEVEIEVKCMIKNENVDGVSGSEMVMYMTVHSLKRAETNGTNKAPVYAIVFKQGSDGKWNDLGDIYNGTATVTTYTGGNGDGSFNTDTWRSVSQSYPIVSGKVKGTTPYSYTVSEGVTLSNVLATVMTVNSDAIAAFDQLLDKAEEVQKAINTQQMWGSAVEQFNVAMQNAAPYYTDNGNGTYTAKSGVTLNSLIPILKELDTALISFNNYIK